MSDFSTIQQDLKAGLKIFKGIERAAEAVDLLVAKEQEAGDLDRLITERKAQAEDAKATLDGLAQKVDEGKAKAKKVITDAETKAQEMLDKATVDAQEIRDDADRYRDRVLKQAEDLEAKKASLKADISAEEQRLTDLKAQAAEVEGAINSHKEALKKTLGAI